MRKLLLLFIVVVYCVRSSEAQSSPDWQTITFLHDFTRHVTPHEHTRKPIPCIHTRNLASAHSEIWYQWVKERRWPRSVYHANAKKSKSDATAVVRLSWYLYEDSAHEIEINSKGQMVYFGARYDMGWSDDSSIAFSRQQMQELQTILTSLPPSRRVTKWSDALFISGRRNGRWFVRMHSRQDKSNAVQKIVNMLVTKEKLANLQPHERP